MPAPRKPSKRDALQSTRENAPQTREDAPQRDFSAYKATDTVAVSTRLSRAQRDRIARYAAERGLKPGQLLRAWILERMRQDNV